eukprot:gene20105-44939_t
MLGGILIHPLFHARAVRHIHNACAERVVRAPLSWFESTPSGRTAARFSADMALIDFALAVGGERTNREMKRMASMANAPVLTLLSETTANRGQTVIRVMGFGPIAAALLFINFAPGADSAQVALGLALAFSVPSNMQTASTFFALFRVSLAGLERVLQLLGPDVDEEAAWHTPHDAALPQQWPAKGEVEFDAASLVYRPGLPAALDR